MVNVDIKQTDLATDILKILLPYKKVQNAHECHHNGSLQCSKTHLNKIKSRIELGVKIQFVLPAFPAKSSNDKKTYGPAPDLGEVLALQELNLLCDKINAIYEPGAEMIICSDGRVFNDLVHVSDDNVKLYINLLMDIIKNNHLSNIIIFRLEDHYDHANYQTMRSQLEVDFADSLDLIKENVKQNIGYKNLFNGIHRFVYEDQIQIFSNDSKNKIRSSSKLTAYKVIQRSNAWGKLVAKEFPEAVRLSIHPQLCGSEKFGIILIDSRNKWATPWHRVVVQENQTYSLIKKSDAEKLRAIPVFNKNNFSHYKVVGTN